MEHLTSLRPVERCVLRMSAEGLPDGEIGRRLRRSPAHVERVRRLAHVPRSPSPPAHPEDPLRPVERCVLRWIDHGNDYSDIARLFHRSPSFVELVEQMAHYKLRR